MTTPNTALQVTTELRSLAHALNEREESIRASLEQFRGLIADLLVHARQQGNDIIAAKVKLDGRMAWHDWLRTHVPSIHPSQAARYERLAARNITDVRQAMFAFVPPRQVEAGQAKRTPPAPWEQAWKYCYRLRRIPIGDDWPREQIEYLRSTLEHLLSLLDMQAGPSKTKSSGDAGGDENV